MDSNLLVLYHKHVAMSFDRQMRFSDFLEREGVAGQDYNYTISKATLTFGSRVRLEVHDLGSHADPDNSWLWTWGNRQLRLTPANRDLADRVRALARSTGVQAFAAERQIALTPLLGEELSEHAAHVFAGIVVGELGYEAYYTLPFEHGRAATLIRDDRLRLREEFPLNRIAILFPQVLSALPVFDHKAALSGYALALGVAVSEGPDGLRLNAASGGELAAAFDTRGRLISLKGTFGPGNVEEKD